jgi:hypothetical protein
VSRWPEAPSQIFHVREFSSFRGSVNVVVEERLRVRLQCRAKPEINPAAHQLRRLSHCNVLPYFLVGASDDSGDGHMAQKAARSCSPLNPLAPMHIVMLSGHLKSPF